MAEGRRFGITGKMEEEILHRILGFVKEIEDWEAEIRTTGLWDH